MMYKLLKYQKSIKTFTNSLEIDSFNLLLNCLKQIFTVDVSASSQLSFRILLKTSHRTLNHCLQTKYKPSKFTNPVTVKTSCFLLPKPLSKLFKKTHLKLLFFSSPASFLFKRSPAVSTCRLLLRPSLSPRNALNSSRTDVKLKLSYN